MSQEKKSVCYIWTEKAERLSAGKKKAGEPATYNGHPIKDKLQADAWKRYGWVEEVPKC